MFSNKFPIFLVATLLLFTACDPLKKVQPSNNNSQSQSGELDEIEGTKVYNPETGKYETKTDVTGEMEEVEWTDGSATEAPPIGSDATDRIGFPAPGNNPDTPPGTNPANEEDPFDTDFERNELPSYNMVLALPFLANQNSTFDSEINEKSIFALNFYEGAKMAFEVLANENVNLEVNVLDTRAAESETRGLTYNSAVQDAHVIIGTFKNSTAKIMAEYALNNKKPFVSPYYPHNALVENNPYFVQLNPSIFTHCNALIRFLKRKYTDDQIVLIGRETRRDRGIINLYQKAHYTYAGSTSIEPLKEVIITDNNSTLENTELKEHFMKDKPTVFVIASSQESFVYAILRKIDIEKKNFDEEDEDVILESDELVVFGQPRWKDFTKISYDYYEKLNLHITSDNHIDPNAEIIRAFKQNFYAKYGSIPTEEAYKGFDTVLYFGRMLNQYGTEFLSIIDQVPHQGLQSNFNINRTVTKTRPLDDANLNSFDQMENTHVHILAFKDYQFMVAQ